MGSTCSKLKVFWDFFRVQGHFCQTCLIHNFTPSLSVHLFLWTWMKIPFRKLHISVIFLLKLTLCFNFILYAGKHHCEVIFHDLLLLCEPFLFPSQQLFYFISHITGVGFIFPICDSNFFFLVHRSIKYFWKLTNLFPKSFRAFAKLLFFLIELNYSMW